MKQMKKKTGQVRQGDVLIEKVARIPKGKRTKLARDGERVILAYGEVTGHAHAICEPYVEQIELETGERFVVSESGLKIVHEEHDAISRPAGNYKVTRQREYSPQEIRNVAD